MKKIYLAAGILLMTSTVIFAQGTSENNYAAVSPLIKSQFATDFPNATNVYFASEKNFDEITFTQNKEKISAYYDYNNQLVGTTQKKTFDDLPGNAKQKILKDYPGYTIADVIRFDDYESSDPEMILYGTPFHDADNYFVELKNESGAIVVKVDLSGGVDFAITMK